MIDFNPFSLAGKQILVTGASSGIGKEIAIRCARMDASVILTARNKERLAQTAQEMPHADRHLQIIADICDDNDLEQLTAELPTLDGVVVCVGKGLTLPFQFATKDKFMDLFLTNFFAPTELIRLLYKKKLISKNGSIVILSSLGGNQIFSGGNSIYGASKAALNSIMKFCAKEFAPRKIRVNSICPGMVDTPFIHRGTITEEQLAQDKQRYLLKRYGTSEDIANGAIYLLSDASSWMTGESLVIDGGVSVK
ncbi:dehydrogenase of unknown specificity, short-chain alcohol dehydrogenase like protein [Prevotella dentalis DSM 3688]|uniref:3-oxoacyl-[acyl-carrier-protein] reductase n=1 Tax=Prevotella dentalis (strain ATCC 49559 / DSM 3688 / JCM 13448 / NCTC 12043 / ES 2772) TaxID=908937 RepID=F9D6A3_PREDD|nr:SDR family oxidoreductase [Prevotella dentalis]AGB29469.1 dehydrogenase of unknown specificity, short-chain alcohol dehydrogenase like protein [Prevotella dentalis DSM 3688]EGQ12498.1 3-oxoacyl-[acyl-carrier-protein] reductase [Prevotella dentalis DSM 3688]